MIYAWVYYLIFWVWAENGTSLIAEEWSLVAKQLGAYSLLLFSSKIRMLAHTKKINFWANSHTIFFFHDGQRSLIAKIFKLLTFTLQSLAVFKVSLFKDFSSDMKSDL